MNPVESSQFESGRKPSALYFQGLNPIPKASLQEAQAKAKAEPLDYFYLTDEFWTKKGKTTHLLKATGEHQRVLHYLRAILKPFIRQRPGEGHLLHKLDGAGIPEAQRKEVAQAAENLYETVTGILAKHPKDIVQRETPIEPILEPHPTDSLLSILKNVLKLALPLGEDNLCLLGALGWVGADEAEKQAVQKATQALERAIVGSILEEADPDCTLLNEFLHAKLAPPTNQAEYARAMLLVPSADSSVSPMDVLKALQTYYNQREANTNPVLRFLKNTFTFSATLMRYGAIESSLLRQLRLSPQELQKHLHQLAAEGLILCYEYAPDQHTEKARWEILPQGQEVLQKGEQFLLNSVSHNSFATILEALIVSRENHLLILEDRESGLQINEAYLERELEAIAQEKNELLDEARQLRSKKKRRQTREDARRLDAVMEKKVQLLNQLRLSNQAARKALGEEVQSTHKQLELLQNLKIQRRVNAECQDLETLLNRYHDKMARDDQWQSQLEAMLGILQSQGSGASPLSSKDSVAASQTLADDVRRALDEEVQRQRDQELSELGSPLAQQQALKNKNK